jgi:hypothetical protein
MPPDPERGRTIKPEVPSHTFGRFEGVGPKLAVLSDLKDAEPPRMRIDLLLAAFD